MIERNYPVVNDWRKGCWAARPNGKADRDYTYQREWLTGTPDKANGILKYSLADCGGPGWIVTRDRQGTRALLELRDLSYVDHGDTHPADVLAVVQAGSWDGLRCPTHSRIILAGHDCPECQTERETDQRRAAYAATAPTTDPF